ncbi:prefoldin subunit beta [Candidatus Woesearchaeota archaeon]|nr:prefoldin subunit beta [Candidatus Woesearchaeota archaeon]
MDISKDTEEKINQIQFLEQNLQNLFMQRQNFQSKLLEVDNALDELKKSNGETYKIVGNIMIKGSREEFIKELESKKEIINLRIKNLEKQEEKLKERASKIQNEVVETLKKEK